MIRFISALSHITRFPHPYRSTLAASMSGLKLRTNKKSTSTVLEKLSTEYMQKNSDEQNKKNKTGKNVNAKAKVQDDEA